MLTVGCDCPSRLAARDTLDSVRSVCSTRIMCESMLSLDIVRLDLWRGGHLVFVVALCRRNIRTDIAMVNAGPLPMLSLKPYAA
ncbi:hypothetical protein BTHE68_55310 [Burkholderia sp. THE68]|nr:hypothetical protein BTHE68_55310 [Burkholderia sp. THE68]